MESGTSGAGGSPESIIVDSSTDCSCRRACRGISMGGIFGMKTHPVASPPSEDAKAERLIIKGRGPGIIALSAL